MRVENFDFGLPDYLIAKEPLEKRDSSRLMVLSKDGSIEDRSFSAIQEYMTEGDLLILNCTKVVPVRLTGRKSTGGRLEILLVRREGRRSFKILSRGRYSGRLHFNAGIEAEIYSGERASFNTEKINDFLWQHGSMPLPPYIKRRPDIRDREWYQTTYAEREGSIAAPTAGLHFTEELLSLLTSKGVIVRKLILHVGTGTFKPVQTAMVEDHRMEAEEFEVHSDLIDLIHKTRKSGKRVFAVGTTTTRTIEALMSGQYERQWTGFRSQDSEVRRKKTDGELQITNYKSQMNEGGLPSEAQRAQAEGGRWKEDESIIRGSTDIFISPGYQFKGIDSLLTNFHLPRSTPLMLVSALAGRERILHAYREAISMKYRFFSYGDAMLLL